MKDLLRLLAMLRPYWSWLALSIVLALAAVLANVGLMATAGWFITAMGLAGVAGLTINYFTPAALIRAFAIVRTGGRYTERLLGHEATLRVLAGLRSWIFSRLEPLAPAGLVGYRSGDLLTQLRADIDRLETLFLRILLPAVVGVMASLIAAVVLAIYSPAIAMMQLVLFALAGLLLPFAAARIGARPAERLTHGTASLNAALVDTFEGLAELRIYGQTDAWLAAIGRRTEELIDDERRLSSVSALSQAAVSLTANLALAATLAVAVAAIKMGQLQPAELAMLAFLVLASFEAIAPVPAAMQLLRGTLASARRLFATADATPPVVDPQRPLPLPTGSTLVFEKVSLIHPDAECPVLSDIDLQLQAGRRIGLLGPSGSGKSSIVQLALRFMEPTAGTITFGGVAAGQLRAEDIRSRIAVVPQHAHLFAATIAENLRMARPGASQNDLERVCRLAQLDSFIVAQPAGYDTFVGNNGLQLSGGEARRLAVARALLKEAPILLLDEPTEGMDTATERALIDAVLASRADAAVLLVTHRPSVLTMMDEIVLLENGRIVERGAPAALMRSSVRFQAFQDSIDEPAGTGGI
ncbi:MAG: thiol reductant ABC exporter subunit CydC [Hyphomicrobiaceae bacterium]